MISIILLKIKVIVKNKMFNKCLDDYNSFNIK